MKNFIISTISFLTRTKFNLLRGSRVSFGKNFICSPNLKITGPGTVIFGDNVNLWSFSEPNQFQTYDPKAKIIIGNNTRINGAIFQAREKITISNDCLIGSAILIDNDFHPLDPNKRREKTGIATSPIKVESNIWIAGQTAILKGVKIGQNSVVGFRSVVTRDVASNTVVAGNPAKEIKKI